MASPTVQMNVRVSPELADAVKARADQDGLKLNAAVIEALEAYTSNGPATPSEQDLGSGAATKGTVPQ